MVPQVEMNMLPNTTTLLGAMHPLDRLAAPETVTESADRDQNRAQQRQPQTNLSLRHKLALKAVSVELVPQV